jgi:hypothetical protein
MEAVGSGDEPVPLAEHPGILICPTKIDVLRCWLDNCYRVAVCVNSEFGMHS